MIEFLFCKVSKIYNIRSRSDSGGLATRPTTGIKQQSKKRPPVHQQLQPKSGHPSTTLLQSDICNEILRTQTPRVDVAAAAAVSGVVTSELFESVINNPEEDYSEDLLPETAAEMGQGTLY